MRPLVTGLHPPILSNSQKSGSPVLKTRRVSQIEAGVTIVGARENRRLPIFEINDDDGNISGVGGIPVTRLV